MLQVTLMCNPDGTWRKLCIILYPLKGNEFLQNEVAQAIDFMTHLRTSVCGVRLASGQTISLTSVAETSTRRGVCCAVGCLHVSYSRAAAIP
jgi:hypothetical protein